jgi:DNA-binding NarL/FixJ family response regulator
MSQAIRVLVADDHPLVRAGVVGILSNDARIRVVGEAASGDDAIALAGRVHPEIVLLDLSMPGPPASVTVRAMRECIPQVRIIVLTAYHDRAQARALIAGGVAGYVLKSDAPEAVVDAIRTVHEGGAWLSPEIATGLAEAHPIITSGLTPREQELLALLQQGSDAADMAAKLNLRDQTVRNYLHQLYGKLGVSSRAEALLWLRTHGS